MPNDDMGKTTCSDSFYWKKWIDLQHLERLQHQMCCTIMLWPSGTTLAKKKNHHRDSRREKRCSTCDIMLDQARSAQGKSDPRLPATFVVDRQKRAYSFCAVSELCTEMSPWLAVMMSVDIKLDVVLRTQIPWVRNRFQHSHLEQWLKDVRIFRVSADNVSK